MWMTPPKIIVRYKLSPSTLASAKHFETDRRTDRVTDSPKSLAGSGHSLVNIVMTSCDKIESDHYRLPVNYRGKRLSLPRFHYEYRGKCPGCPGGVGAYAAIE